MADVVLYGFTVPSQPNSGLAVFDTDSAPEQASYKDTGISFTDAPLPVRLTAIDDSGGALRATFDAPILIDPGTETHSGLVQWTWSTPTVTNTVSTGRLDTAIAVTPATLQAIDVTLSQINLHFDWPVGEGLPAITPFAGAGAPTITGTLAIDGGNGIRLDYTPWVTTITFVQSKTNFLDVTFDFDVNAGAPVILPGDLNAPTITSTSQVFANEVKVNWTLVSSAPHPTPSVSGLAGVVTVVFNHPVVLTELGAVASNWTFTPVGGATPIICTGVSLAGDNVTVTLNTSLQTIGVNNYLLNLKLGLVTTIADDVADVVGSFPFNGTVASAFSIVSAVPDADASHIVVTFTRAADMATALLAINYSLVPPLTVVSVTRVSDTVVRILTANMGAGVIYTLTVSNVTDPAGNPLI